MAHLLNQPAPPAEDSKPAVVWPCYEPARPVELSESDVLEHVLLVGSTGCGKTTLLTTAYTQLIARSAADPLLKTGLLILDSKAELLPSVSRAAQDAGRPHDVVVLGPEGNACYDLFGPLKSFEEVETVTKRLLLAVPPLGGDNAYWQTATTAMVAAGLSLLVATQPFLTFDLALQFLRTWFTGPPRPLPELVQEVVTRAKQQLPPPGKGARAARNHQLQSALDQVALYQDLDQRTRSNLQSCLLQVLRPLACSEAARCFGQKGRPPFDPGEAVRDGLVCVVSVNALTHPELAQFLFRLARHSFFAAAQSRAGGANRRLCGLVADEFPLVVCRTDAEQLATLRSRRCFVLAATQGLAGIDAQVGERVRQALVQHFNTLVFLRSREPETGWLAEQALGLREEQGPRVPPDTTPSGALAVAPAPRRRHAHRVPVCPLGSLYRLGAHQGYVLYPDGHCTEFPVWFAPWFETDPEPAQALEMSVADQSCRFDPDHLHGLMARAGYRVVCPPEVVPAAFDLCRPKERKGRLIARVARFFRTRTGLAPAGLETLPRCWLTALPAVLSSFLARRAAEPPWRIDALACREGMLLVRFAQEPARLESGMAREDRIRVAINASLYPTVWRPLLRRHFAAIWRTRPELHTALAGPGIDV
jgi:energy-coupling factor transporter ATP-binding protein EcfA2